MRGPPVRNFPRISCYTASGERSEPSDGTFSVTSRCVGRARHHADDEDRMILVTGSWSRLCRTGRVAWGACRWRRPLRSTSWNGTGRRQHERRRGQPRRSLPDHFQARIVAFNVRVCCRASQPNANQTRRFDMRDGGVGLMSAMGRKRTLALCNQFHFSDVNAVARRN